MATVTAPFFSAQVLVCANNFMAKVELEDPGRGGEVKLEAMDARCLSRDGVWCAKSSGRRVEFLDGGDCRLLVRYTELKRLLHDIT